MSKKITSAEFDALCENTVKSEDLVPDTHMDYDDWIDWTGRDSSFVGTPDLGIPGSADLYAAVERILDQTVAPKV